MTDRPAGTGCVKAGPPAGLIAIEKLAAKGAIGQGEP
jgi:hypothetical protein